MESGLGVESIWQISAQDLHASRSEGRIAVLDVRRPAEWNEGRIQGARHIPLDDLQKRLPELSRNRTTAVYCKSGYRSTIACSLLQASGFENVWNILGVFDAWSGAQLPIEK